MSLQNFVNSAASPLDRNKTQNPIITKSFAFIVVPNPSSHAAAVLNKRVICKSAVCGARLRPQIAMGKRVPKIRWYGIGIRLFLTSWYERNGKGVCILAV